MLQISSKTLTLEEFLKLPETKPASEYIDNRIIQKPMPQGKHSVIQGEFVTVSNAVLKPERIARAFPELRCTFGGRSIVPDVSVFVWDRIPRDANGEIGQRLENKTQARDEPHHAGADYSAADHVAGIMHAGIHARQRVQNS